MNADSPWLPGLPAKPPLSAAEPARRAPAYRSGRSATPRVLFTSTAPRPNPSGRTKLIFGFRPLRRHQPLAAPEIVIGCQSEIICSPAFRPGSVCSVACSLIAEYFQLIGGFRQADDAVVREWADLLLPPSDKPGGGPQYSVQQIRAAVAAKAKSLRGADPDEVEYKLGLRGRADTFPRRLDYWLDIAGLPPPADPLPPGTHARLDELAASRTTPDTRDLKPATPDPPAPGSRLALLLDHAAAAASDGPWYRAIWDALPDRRRQLVNHALVRDWHDYVRAFDRSLDSADMRLDPLWLEWRAREAIRRWGAPRSQEAPP